MIRRVLALAAAVVAAITITPTAASAGSSYISRTTGITADAYWTQIDGTPVGTSQFGNVHVGSLYAYETSRGVGDVFAYITDYDCEEGQLPDGGHGLAGGCTFIGERYGEGFGLAVSIDKKLNNAAVQGRLTMTQGGGHGEPGGVVGNPPVDMVWNGFGDVIKTTSTYRYNDGNSSFTDRYRSNLRQASVDGTLGPMSFDPNLSGGSISTFSAFSKGRTP